MSHSAKASSSTPRWLVGLVVVSTALPGATALGYVKHDMDPWPGGWIEYKINEDSFNTGVALNGLALSDAQARYWVRYSAEQWRWRTGADLTFSFEGDTNLGDSESDCYGDSGDNFIAAVPGCVHDDSGADNCAVLALTSNTFYSTSKARVRSTLCIHGGQSGASAPNWEVDADDFVAGGTAEMDLISVLVHEWGHWLGLRHSGNTVMHQTIAADRMIRHPTDDDVRGMRSIYPPDDQYLMTVKPISGSTVQTGWSMGYTPWSMHGATVASLNGQSYVIRAKPSISGDSLHFTRAPLPLAINTSWTNRSLSVETGPETRLGAWASPGLAAGEGVVVAAWPNKVANYNTCSGITVARTADLFDSASRVTLTSDCTFSPVSVAYDAASGRFVLFYQRFDASASSPTERIWARTSTDGTTWSAAVDLGVRTVHPPAANTDSSGADKAIVYAHRSIDPYLFTRSWSVSNGTVSLSSSWTSRETRQFLPPNLGSRSSSFVILWNAEDTFNAFAEFHTEPPFGQFDDLINLGEGRNPPALMGHPGTSTSYLLRSE